MGIRVTRELKNRLSPATDISAETDDPGMRAGGPQRILKRQVFNETPQKAAVLG